MQRTIVERLISSLQGMHVESEINHDILKVFEPYVTVKDKLEYEILMEDFEETARLSLAIAGELIEALKKREEK